METNEIACTLPGPELVERIHDWRRVTSRALRRTIDETSVTSVYPNDPALVAELRRLIDAEKDCCSFLDFSVEESADHLAVELRVPDGMQHVLALMMGMATDEVIPA